MTLGDQNGGAGWTATHRVLVAAVWAGLGLPPVAPPPARPVAAAARRGPVDWDLFERLVGRHRVLPLVHRGGLAGLGAPDDLVARVGVRARAAAVRALAQLDLVTELVGLLRAAGIDVLVLKGLPLAQAGYGDLAARDPGDIDLLIDPAQVAAATRLLVGRGLAVQTWPKGPPPALIEPALRRAADLPALGEISFTGEGTRIDLHWRLFANPALFPMRPAWLTEPAEVLVGPVRLPVLPADQRWPYLAVHGTEHGWRRLKWLADVPAVARTAAGAAPDRRADRSVATGLLVAEAVFGPFLPADRRAWAARVPGTAVLRRRSLAALAGGADPDESVGPRQLGSHLQAKLALRPGIAYRRAEARNWLIRAGRAQLVPDPPAAALLAGPVRWAARHAAGPAGRAGMGWAGIGWALLDRRWGRWLLRHGARAYRRGLRVAGLARLGAGRRRLLLEAVLELIRASVELVLLPSDRIVPRLGERAGAVEPPAGLEQCRAAVRIGSAVAVAARRLPWRPTCLRQAVAAGRMLRRRGIRGQIHLGVATEPGALSAHAWVTVGGRTVLGGRGAGRYTPVAAFAAGRSTVSTPE
ncbi:MAG: hypothetical protein V7637_1632 [Mycobacteriales bacterium]